MTDDDNITGLNANTNHAVTVYAQGKHSPVGSESLVHGNGFITTLIFELFYRNSSGNFSKKWDLNGDKCFRFNSFIDDIRFC